MSVIVYKNAVLVYNGLEMQAAVHELNLNSVAEMLDNTVMGLNTRTKVAGLFNDSIAGKAFMDTAVGIESVLFNHVGGNSTAANQLYQAGSVSDDDAVLLFPDGVTEGSNGAGSGFAIKGTIEKFDIGGQVGALLDIDFSITRSGEN